MKKQPVTPLTFEEFSSKKTTREIFETVPCTRCGGSGKYSFNLIDMDLCYGCNGSGFKFTKRGDTHRKFYMSAQEVFVSDLKIGDRVSLSLGMSRKQSWVTVEKISQYGYSIVDGVRHEQIEIVTKNGTHSYVCLDSNKIRIAMPVEKLYQIYLEAITK